MKILFIGDVVGTNGVDLLRKGLPALKKEYGCDVCIVNGENSNESGTGMNRNDARDIFACGADVITGGNHSMRRANMALYTENEYILCPANLLYSEDGCGVATVDLGRHQLTVINLMGVAFIDNHRNPFFELDKILKDVDCKNIIVDFHAESTAEKYAFANYADGRVSAVIGTHTHVQTNDEQILPKGTGFISDAGAVCAVNSVLGVQTVLAVEKQKYLKPVQFKVEHGPGYICGVYIETDSNGETVKIEKVKKYVDI
ncbi:MAG: YmdB family metallophosphoesterase [Oscillospiraceae bacterium]|nr:YmdB family metallophosphoesterase [Oscillospiraceae bacterium]